jgi:hypothetical protein
MKYILLIILVFVCIEITAGDRVGNGGDVVICKSTIRILDYEEADQLNLKINMNKKNVIPYIDRVTSIIKKFKEVDKELSKQYLKRLETIIKEINFKDNVDLVDVKDSKHFMLPKGCALKQIAIKLTNAQIKADGSKISFIVDKSLWDKLDSNNKAGLILHEIIYEHFFILGEKNSVKARYMNSLITHFFDNGVLPGKYKKLLQKMKIPIYR